MKKYFSILFLFALLAMSSCCVNSSDEDIRNMNISGKITKKYLDEWNHGAPTVICQSNENVFKYQLLNWTRKDNLWEYLQVGDSIIKPSGILTLRAKKTNGNYKDYKYQKKSNCLNF